MSLSSPPPKKKKPVHIGQYEIGRTLGEGSFSKVKLATDIFTGKKFAIKIIDWSLVDNVDDQTECVEREIKIMKLLNHPNIVKLHEIISHKDDKQTFLVLEYVSRGELFDYIVANGRIKEPESRRFWRQLVSAVEYCHAFLVVHRDLKPSNLLLAEDGSLKVTDFGLSNTMTPGKLFTTWCGSLYYSAPEIVEEKKYVGPAVDVWSMGGILYSLVNGRLPWSGKTDLEKIKQIIAADIAPYDRDVSAACIALCKGCLTVDPKLRYTVPQLRLDPWTNLGYDAPPPCLVPQTKPVEKVSDSVIEQLIFLGILEDEPSAIAAAKESILKNHQTQVVYAYHTVLTKPQLLVSASYLPRDKIKQAISAIRVSNTTPKASGIGAAVVSAADLSVDESDTESSNADGVAIANSASADHVAPKSSAAPIAVVATPATTATPSAAAATSSSSAATAAVAAPTSAPTASAAPVAVQAAATAVAATAAPAATATTTTTTTASTASTTTTAALSSSTTTTSTSTTASPPTSPVVRHASGELHVSGSVAAPAPSPAAKARPTAVAKGPVHEAIVETRRRSRTVSAGSRPTPPSEVAPRTPPAGPIKMSDVLKNKLSGAPPPPPPPAVAAATVAAGGAPPPPSSPPPPQQQPVPVSAASKLAAESIQTRRRSQSVGQRHAPQPPPPPPAGAATSSTSSSSSSTASSSTTSSSVTSWAANLFRRKSSKAIVKNDDASELSSSSTSAQSSDFANEGDANEMRTVKGVFKCATTSTRPPDELLAAIERALLASDQLKYKRKSRWLVRCADKKTKVRLDIEVVNIEKLDGLYGIRFARITGDTFVYKKVAEDLMSLVARGV